MYTNRMDTEYNQIEPIFTPDIKFKQKEKSLHQMPKIWLRLY